MSQSNRNLENNLFRWNYDLDLLSSTKTTVQTKWQRNVQWSLPCPRAVSDPKTGPWTRSDLWTPFLIFMNSIPKPLSGTRSNLKSCGEVGLKPCFPIHYKWVFLCFLQRVDEQLPVHVLLLKLCLALFFTLLLSSKNIPRFILRHCQIF